MKYILKHDLPTYPAGTECHLSKKGNLVSTEDGLVIYAKSTLDKFPNILTDWLEPIPEKVKPKAVPDIWDMVYTILDTGVVRARMKTYGWDIGSLGDQGHWRWTFEEAEAEVAKRAAIERVRRYLVENDLLETDKEQPYRIVFTEDRSICAWDYIGQSRYSPYGRIRCVDINKFLEDCYNDLLLIHS